MKIKCEHVAATIATCMDDRGLCAYPTVGPNAMIPYIWSIDHV